MPSTEEVIVDGISYDAVDDLNRYQFDILALLASRPDYTVSQEEISTYAWGFYNSGTSNRVRQQVYQLRFALGDELGSAEGGAIIARPGFGYVGASSLDGSTPLAGKEDNYHIAGSRIIVDPDALAVICDGKLVHEISPSEFRLIEAVAKQPGETVGSLELMDAMGARTANTDNLRQLFHSLRSKLGPELGDAKNGAIKVIEGLGYTAVRSLADTTAQA